VVVVVNGLRLCMHRKPLPAGSLRGLLRSVCRRLVFRALLCHLLFELGPTFFDHSDQLGLVAEVRMQFFKEREVVRAKALGARNGCLLTASQQFQYAACTQQTGFKHFALHPHNLAFAQPVPVGDIARARHNFQMRKVRLHHVHNFQ